MNLKRWQHRLANIAALAAAACGFSPMALAASGASASNANKVQPSNGAYIVQLAELPVTAYSGGIAGYAATKPAKGQKIDPNDAKVMHYMSYLAARHDALLGAAGGGRKLYSYGVVFNGFAADLSPAQAAALAKTPGVLAVEKDVAQRMATSATPSFLGLTGPSGFWSRTGATGEGVIIGVIDSGIWPEHLSFSDRVDGNGNPSKDGKLAYQQIPGWHGRCVPGEAFNASHCNQKLIGARWFNAAWGGNAGMDAKFNSARDYHSHGTHVASIAGGNANVAVTGPVGTAETVSARISGMAPRARIAAYKVFSTSFAFSADIVAAFDQAVADGVDVINVSLQGSRVNFREPVGIAMLYAAAADVFVAAAAGNDGPADSSVGNIAPWVTTVAAGTHSREALGLLTLGNGVVYRGRSAPSSLPAAALVDAMAVGLPGVNPTQLGTCFGAVDGTVVLDPAKVAGKIVVCTRGETDRVNKSRAVKEAGGVGMVLVQAEDATAYADFHAVPTVHLPSASDGAVVKAYAANAGATAAIQGQLIFNAAAPFTAFFSSRGPLAAANGDLLKPDLTAPGYEILAAVAPFEGDGVLFYTFSGTSMSTPHVAGLGALLKQLHPAWSPMAIQSALMTTASDVLDSASEAGRIFRQGAGHVRPNLAASPGLVFDSGINDWLGFLCGTGQVTATYCAALRIDPSDLNRASIAIGDLVGIQTVKRRLTNVSGNPATFNATLSGLSGFSAVVNPSSLVLAAGQTKEVTVTFTRTSALFNDYSGGQLSWSDGQRTARIPVVLRPVALAAPAEVNTSFSVKFGYSGAFTASGRGLVPSVVTSGNVADDPSDGACSLSIPNAVLTTVMVPAGTTHARFALFDADVKPGSDLDLCVFHGGTKVGESLSATTTETVNLVDPPPGLYTVVVQGWGVVGSSPFKLHSWLLGNASAGNMTITAPTTAMLGQSASIGISTSGLVAGTRYLGAVAYSGAPGLPPHTLVRIEP